MRVRSTRGGSLCLPRVRDPGFRMARSECDEIMSANTKTRRSKALRVALLGLIGAYVCVHAAFTVFALAKQKGHWFLCLESGAFYAVYMSHPYSIDCENWSLRRANVPPAIAWWPRYRSYSDSGQTSRVFFIPLWIPLLPLIALAALLFYRDRTRRVPGFCRKCGYDLRAITAPRCPECGTPTVPETPIEA